MESRSREPHFNLDDDPPSWDWLNTELHQPIFFFEKSWGYNCMTIQSRNPAFFGGM